MGNRDVIEFVGVALLVGGAALLSLPWALMLLGALLILASVAGRAYQCFRP